MGEQRPRPRQGAQERVVDQICGLLSRTRRDHLLLAAAEQQRGAPHRAVAVDQLAKLLCLPGREHASPGITALIALQHGRPGTGRQAAHLGPRAGAHQLSAHERAGDRPRRQGPSRSNCPRQPACCGAAHARPRRAMQRRRQEQQPAGRQRASGDRAHHELRAQPATANPRRGPTHVVRELGHQTGHPIQVVRVVGRLFRIAVQRQIGKHQARAVLQLAGRRHKLAVVQAARVPEHQRRTGAALAVGDARALSAVEEPQTQHACILARHTVRSCQLTRTPARPVTAQPSGASSPSRSPRSEASWPSRSTCWWIPPSSGTWVASSSRRSGSPRRRSSRSPACASSWPTAPRRRSLARGLTGSRPHSACRAPGSPPASG